MKNGLAIWHYNHRTDAENAKFFADNGFNAVSMHGRAMTKTCLDSRARGKLCERYFRKKSHVDRTRKASDFP